MRSDIVSGLQTEIVVIGVVTKCDDYLLMNWMLLSCNHVWNQLERYHDRCTCRSFHSFSVLSDFKLKLKCRNALKLKQFTQTTTIQLLRDKMWNNTICNLKYRLLFLNMYRFVAICGMFMCVYSTRYCFNSSHIYIFVISVS